MNNDVLIKITALDQTKAALKSVQGGFDNLQKSTQSLRNKLDSLQPAFRSMVGYGTVALGAISYGANRTIEAASDLEESINAVNVVFGDGAETILKFGENSARSVGLSNAAFNQLSTVTGALLKDTGLSMEEVAEQTNELTVRAADMASVFNTTVDDALSAINQAIRGETEAIRRYAGDVTDATINQYLLSQGIQRTTTEMTEQEKRLYRLEVIMAQTAVTADDFKNTSESLANVQRIQAAEIENLSAKIGKSLMPVKQQLLQIIGPLLERLSEWVEKNPELTRTIVLATGALAGLTVAVGALGVAVNVLLSPITLIALGLGALAAIVYTVATRFDQLPGIFKIILFPLKAFIEGLKQLWGVLSKVGDAIGWVFDKLTSKTRTAVVEAKKSIYDLNGEFFNFTEGLPYQGKQVEQMATSISTLGSESSDAADKLKKLREEAAGIFGDIDETEADSKRKLAEAIVEQEESITEKKRELRKLERAEDTDANATRIRELKRSIKEEQSALRTANEIRLGLKTEIIEAERRADLTEFERKIEDIQRERLARLEDQVLRLEEIQQEIAAEKMKSSAIQTAFNSAQDNMQAAIVKTREVAEEEAAKMKKAFDRAVLSMSQLNIGGSISLKTSTVARITNVDDAVITPKGDIVSTHPDDWLIATKNPSQLAGGGGPTINVYGTFLDDRAAARRWGNEIMRVLKNQSRL